MLTEEQLIKIIIGIFVFVAVVVGVYLIFKNNILDFFNNLGNASQTPTGGLILFLLK